MRITAYECSDRTCECFINANELLLSLATKISTRYMCMCTTYSSNASWPITVRLLCHQCSEYLRIGVPMGYRVVRTTSLRIHECSGATLGDPETTRGLRYSNDRVRTRTMRVRINYTWPQCTTVWVRINPQYAVNGEIKLRNLKQACRCAKFEASQQSDTLRR